MPMMIWADEQLSSTSRECAPEPYEPIRVGRPLGIRILTFFPGTSIHEWGNRAELMISSQTRVGPSNEPAPRLVNLLVYKYSFHKAEPIQDIGGDIYGDSMLHYTRAYAGQRVGFTLHGVEVDRVGEKTWEAITTTLKYLGSLAMFSSAAPYLAAAGLATQMANTLIRAFNRNDRLSTARTDLYFDEPNQSILQSGRYVAWKGGPTQRTMARNYKLTGGGDDTPNVVVHRASGEPFEAHPYFVIQVDAKERPEYNDFEIGAESAKLLREWGDSTRGQVIFSAVKEMASQVNDAQQLAQIRSVRKKLNAAGSEAEHAALKEKLGAHTELLSSENGDLLRELLKL